jgi:hypothetical protein
MAFTPQRIDPESFKDHIRAKWGDEVLTEGFVPFPKTLLRALPRLFAGSEVVEELGVVLALADYRRRNMRTLPSIEYLAFVAGMPTKAFRAALGRLKAKQWAEEDEDDEATNATSKGFERAVVEALGIVEKHDRKRAQK